MTFNVKNTFAISKQYRQHWFIPAEPKLAGFKWAVGCLNLAWIQTPCTLTGFCLAPVLECIQSSPGLIPSHEGFYNMSVRSCFILASQTLVFAWFQNVLKPSITEGGRKHICSNAPFHKSVLSVCWHLSKVSICFGMQCPWAAFPSPHLILQLEAITWCGLLLTKIIYVKVKMDLLAWCVVTSSPLISLLLSSCLYRWLNFLCTPT